MRLMPPGFTAMQTGCALDHLCNMLVSVSAALHQVHVQLEWMDYAIQFIPPAPCPIERAHTHLERNSEHQHSKDESPEGPVPKHLQVERRRTGLVATSCIHGLVTSVRFYNAYN